MLENRDFKYNLPIKLLFVYLLSAVFTLFIVDNLITKSHEDYMLVKEYLPSFGILFIIITAVILFTILYKSQIAIKQGKDKFVPYKFALDNSIDAVYLFNLEGKFLYVNDAACRMLGYSKEEFYNMHLEQMDLNFDRQGVKNIMHEISRTKNWHLETTQRKKDGIIFPVEVNGHGFSYDGKDYVCAFGRDVTGRMRNRASLNNMNDELQKSLKEKEILIKEIHHRVKNNMEIISSLLSMQARRTDNEKMKYTLMESMSRIQTMALVHEFLYLGKSLAKIDFYEYISRLINDIKELYITQNTKLNIDLHVDKLYLSTDRCIQLGMVLHEICVNSMKYAFKEDKDNLLCIHIKLNDNLVTIKIRDNGEGIKDINAFHKADSIGMQLIRTIVENQLNGEINFVNHDGLECNIKFLREESHYE